jgi:NAD(P)-dependent dehydrogenase (short-subunit alcohol dehydrogenase family)
MAAFDLTGKTVLITGSTDGLGRALAREVLDAGATVIVHGRSPERIEATVDELDGGGAVRSYRADFASLAEVHGLADALIGADEWIDVLVNNAGIGLDDERRLSQDGYELHFAVNYLAGFALTQRLLVADRVSPRIVNVSSLGQQALDFDDLQLEHGYSGIRAYCQSKLAQIMFTFELAQFVQQFAPEITVNALHPATYMPTKMVPSPISTLEEGVEATFRLIADPALAGTTGAFFDGLRQATPDAQAADAEARRRLWAVSAELTAR